MSSLALTPQQLKELRAAHKRFKDKRSAYRVHGIYLLAMGWHQVDVCRALLLDENTLRHYVRRYCEGGIEGLIKTHFTGGQGKLTDEEMFHLDQHLQETLY